MSRPCLDDDLSEPAINNQAGIETIAWLKSWYDDGLSPLSTTMKASERPEELLINGTIALFISGSWHLPAFRENILSYDWDVTYLPCTENGQDADLGGNGFVVTKDSEHPEVAAEFIKFMTNTENMRTFASQAFFNPVRTSALAGLEYAEFNKQVLLIPRFLLEAQFGWVNTYWSVIGPHMADSFGLFFVRQFMLDLPDELLDAARIDGASELTIFRKIVLPLSRPAIAVLIILGFTGRWNAFAWPLVALTKQEMYTVQLGINFMQGYYYSDLPAITAMVVVSVSPSSPFSCCFRDTSFKELPARVSSKDLYAT